MSYPKISLCIPTYERYDTFLHFNLPKYLENPYIDEIVISDETGSDIEKIAKAFPNEPRLKLYKNEKKLGAFFNKDKVVSYAKNDWVCLMDSDNYAPKEYFEAWFKYIDINGLNNKYVYMPIGSPDTPNPNFPSGAYNRHVDFSEWLNKLICKDNIKNLNIPRLVYILNTGNYIFHKFNYLNTLNVLTELYHKCYAVDVHLKNTILILSGATLVVVPNMIYEHPVHPGSYYINNQETSSKICNILSSLYYQM